MTLPRSKGEISKPDLITVLGREGINLNRNNMVQCPLHDDETPSFKVFPDSQKFHCFGCGKNGDVISFIQELKGVGFREALRYLGISGNQSIRVSARETKMGDLVRRFRKWCRDYGNQLADRYRDCLQRTADLKSMEEAERVADLFHQMPVIEYRMDILLNGDDEEKFQLYCEVMNGRI